MNLFINIDRLIIWVVILSRRNHQFETEQMEFPLTSSVVVGCIQQSIHMLLGLIINLYMTTIICKITDFIITLSLNKELVETYVEVLC